MIVGEYWPKALKRGLIVCVIILIENSLYQCIPCIPVFPTFPATKSLQSCFLVVMYKCASILFSIWYKTAVLVIIWQLHFKVMILT